MNAAANKVNPAALAVLPLTVLMALSALLPYFTAGDYYSEYSYSISGWSFFSTVDLLMLLSIPLAALLLAAALTPQLREGKVRISLGGSVTMLEFPLILVPAIAVGLITGLIFFLLALRVLFPPGGLEQGAGLIIGAFLAMASTGAAAATIGIEVAPRRAGAAGPPSGSPPTAPAAPAPPRQGPPPPAPGTRRG